MSDARLPMNFSHLGAHSPAFGPQDEAAEFLQLARLLSPRDLVTVSVIVRRAAEIL